MDLEFLSFVEFVSDDVVDGGVEVCVPCICGGGGEQVGSGAVDWNVVGEIAYKREGNLGVNVGRSVKVCDAG